MFFVIHAGEMQMCIRDRDSTSQDSQDADIPDIQGGQDDSDQGDADAFADDGEASLFRDFEQNGLYD